MYQHISNEIREGLETIILSNIGERLPRKTVPMLAEHYGVSKNHIRYALKAIKKDTGVVGRMESSELKKEKDNEFVTMFRTLNIVRQMPNANRASSTKIIDTLQNRIPHGGAGLLIGTPTPFAVSDYCKNNELLTDELEIAIALNMTTDKNIVPTIVVGNLISPEKAQVKGQLWLKNNSTGSWPIIVGRVDRNSYTKHVVTMVEKHHLTKVVLVTSGVWNCSKPTWNKYHQDFDFKSPSEYLVTEYPNLHIIAMVMNNGMVFNVKHLHNGTEVTL